MAIELTHWTMAAWVFSSYNARYAIDSDRILKDRQVASATVAGSGMAPVSAASLDWML
jgi:hypothetical protein